MSPATRILSGVVIGLWAALTLGAETSMPEQKAAADPAASRSQWERKVVGRTASNRPASLAQHGSAESSWNPVRPVSALTPIAGSPTPSIAPVPDPGSSPAKRSVAAQPAAAAVVPNAPQTVVMSPEDGFVEGPIPMDGPAFGNGPGPCGPSCGEAFDLYCDNGNCDGCGVDCRSLPVMSLSAGVHGFKGPTDAGRNGNFGFQEGVNWGGALGNWCDVLQGWSYQVGMNATQSNFVGDQTLGTFHEGERDQVFFTAGLFHRAVCAGYQWGVVYDYVRDGYLENFDLRQVRAEVSRVFCSGGEVGFWGAWGAGDDQFQGLTIEAKDMYLFFYRKTFPSAAQARLWGGFTSHKDGLIGADLYIPLGNSFALTNSFNYLIPREGSETGGQAQEDWSLAMSLVWYIGRNPCAHQSENRPLMPVADNSYFLFDRRH